MVLACLLPLSGCTSIEGAGSKGYVTENGQVSEFSPRDRGASVSLESEDLAGDPVSLADLRGEVVVVNVWWSNCGPCRHEAPMLKAVAEETADRGVEFLGVNIRDNSAANGQAFVRAFDLPFRSVYDPSGEALLAFKGVPPNAIPTTLVLDREGRIAARVLGPLPSETTLRNLVETVVAEDT